MIDSLWYTFVYIGHAFSFLSSVHRLKHQRESGRMWWDDLLYIAAALVNIVLLGIMLWIHIQSYEVQFFPKAAYVITLNGYFIATWVVRAAVSVSLVRHLLIVTSRVHMQMALSFFFIMTGIAFSASGTVVCMLGFARVQEFRHKHLPLAFIIPVISGDILADSCMSYLVIRFYMKTTFNKKMKAYIILGVCGPLSTTFITTVFWTLSLTTFSSNTLAQMSLLNLTVSYSVAMCSMLNFASFLYHYRFPIRRTVRMNNVASDHVVFDNYRAANDVPNSNQDDNNNGVIPPAGIQNNIAQDRVDFGPESKHSSSIPTDGITICFSHSKFDMKV